jgi:hypothetical protein
VKTTQSAREGVAGTTGPRLKGKKGACVEFVGFNQELEESIQLRRRKYLETERLHNSRRRGGMHQVVSEHINDICRQRRKFDNIKWYQKKKFFLQTKDKKKVKGIRVLMLCDKVVACAQ